MNNSNKHLLVTTFRITATMLSFLFVLLSVLSTIDYIDSLKKDMIEIGELEDSETEKEKEGEEKEFDDLFYELTSPCQILVTKHHHTSSTASEQSAIREITTPPPEIS